MPTGRGVFLALLLSAVVLAADANRLLLIYEQGEPELRQLFLDNAGEGVEVASMQIDHEADESSDALCARLAAQPVSAVVDLSWNGWDVARAVCADNGLAYVHVEASNKPFLQAVDKLLYQREAIDAAILYQTETDLDQSLYHIIGNFNLRVLVLSMEETDPFRRMSDLRPVPSAFVALGTTEQLTQVIRHAQKVRLVRRDSRWNFVVEDFEAPAFATAGVGVDIVVVSMTPAMCCGLNGMPEATDPATCLAQCPAGTRPKQLIVKKASKMISSAVAAMTPQSYTCNLVNPSNDSRNAFMALLDTEMAASGYKFNDIGSLTYPIELQFKLVRKMGKGQQMIAKWTEAGGVDFEEAFKNKPIPRFFRVGMVLARPWLFEKKDKRGKVQKDKQGNVMYRGYCMELLDKIAKEKSFEYEIVIPQEKNHEYKYGKKREDGSWSGLIGDLANGDTDLIVADLTMTSEREEVIDFVSPYFDQAGISIVLRKKVQEQSLFKFLTVLKPEVWFGIVGAVIVTAVLIWLLDRYSPYSARNNKTAYPYPCRDFTLKESFWFALTSLTPQGGGEAPKALSGRVLVAAYWLFVVLMLATFTANLAAFLTVERMQTTVQSLEELARQSRINYTVLANSSYMEYFVNMAGAEEELYLKWKELTLNSTGNPAKYRVWDYPIREQYTHLLKVIQETGMVQNSQEGFDKVLANEKGEYAFIHDAATVKYEVYNNCNLTMVGEQFAEQPYALAVQQGSHLQEELSRVILLLQKDRYFETLQSKYWNNSNRNNCPVLDDSEGITLRSLGGVFIATLIGLGLALATLAIEVYLQKKNDAKVDDVKHIGEETGFSYYKKNLELAASPGVKDMPEVAGPI